MEIDQLLKLKEIDQLESAILQFSKNTLATKKIGIRLLYKLFGGAGPAGNAGL